MGKIGTILPTMAMCFDGAGKVAQLSSKSISQSFSYRPMECQHLANQLATSPLGQILIFFYIIPFSF